MKLTTSCDSTASNSSSGQGRRSPPVARMSAPGTRAAQAWANDSDGSTAATCSAPTRAGEVLGQRARPAADVQHPHPGRDPTEGGEQRRQPTRVTTHVAVVAVGWRRECHAGIVNRGCCPERTSTAEPYPERRSRSEPRGRRDRRSPSRSRP